MDTHTHKPGGSGDSPAPPDPDRTQSVAVADTRIGGHTASAASLRLTIRAGCRRAPAFGQTIEHILTEVAATERAAAGAQRLPVNVSLVIDRSGSMEGAPLEYVKEACAHVVDRLEPTDVLSIVTFEEDVDVLMPARHVTDRELIKKHIERLQPGNTTNLYDALQAAGAEISSAPLSGYATRILLLTDGEPTAGLRDYSSIVGLVADLKSRGVTVTALGFGTEYNEELMAGIARASGGNYYFISAPDQIPDVFNTELETVLGVTATGVRLSLQLPRGCTVRQVYGSPPIFGARSAEIALPDIERGATITKVWEVEWNPRRAGAYRIASATLEWDDAQSGRRERASADAVVEFVTDPADTAADNDSLVAEELEVVRASRDLHQTMAGVRTQQISVAEATVALERTQSLLAQQGRTQLARDVAEATMALQRGEDSGAEKTLMGTIYQLDQGKRT